MELNLVGSGYWKINGTEEEYYGDLYLNKDEGGIAVYLQIPNQGSPHGFLKLPLSFESIHGKLVSGVTIILIDCIRISTNSQIGGGGVDTFGYNAKYMIQGSEIEENKDLIFTKVSFYLPNIIDWGNKSNLTFPEKYNETVFIQRDIFEPVLIYSCERFSVKYDLTLEYAFGSLQREKIELEQNPYIIIQCDKGETLEWYFRKIFEIKRIIEIATGNILDRLQLIRQFF